MLDIRQLVEQADLPADQKACIAARLEKAGIDSYEKLQNAPRLVGHPVCGTVDVYRMVQALNAAYEADVPGEELAALLDPETAQKLVAGGFQDAETVAYASDAQLLAVDGIGVKTRDRIREAIPAAAAIDDKES